MYTCLLISSYFSLDPGHNFLLSVSGVFFKIPHIMKSKFSIFLSPPGLFHLASMCSSMCQKWQDFLLSHGWIVFIHTHPYITFSFSTDRHLGCFHVLKVVNAAAINMVVQVSLKDPNSISFTYVPRLLDHRVVIFLIFWRTSTLFSILAVPLDYQGVQTFSYKINKSQGWSQ